MKYRLPALGRYTGVDSLFKYGIVVCPLFLFGGVYKHGRHQQDCDMEKYFML